MGLIRYLRAHLDLLLDLSRLNVHAMRLGPGKHLKGRVLMEGAVKPEEVIDVH